MVPMGDSRRSADLLWRRPMFYIFGLHYLYYLHQRKIWWADFAIDSKDTVTVVLQDLKSNNLITKRYNIDSIRDEDSYGYCSRFTAVEVEQN